MQGNLETSSLDVLSSALDLARVGFARWDAEDRLVVFNDTYRTLVYPNLQNEVRLGRKFVDLAGTFYGQPANLPPGRTTEEMIAERLKRRTDQYTSFEYHSNKRWFRVAECRTSDGGAVGLYIDVTKERRNEQMAREGERRLRLLFDNMRNIAYCLGTRGESGFPKTSAGPSRATLSTLPSRRRARPSSRALSSACAPRSMRPTTPTSPSHASWRI